MFNWNFLLFRELREIKESGPRNYEEGIEFVRQHGKEAFFDKVKKRNATILSYHFYILFLLSPFYYAICHIALLFDYEQFNADVYYFLKSLYIPVHIPHGWNLSYIASSIINFCVFIYILRIMKFAWILRIVRFTWRNWFKFFFFYLFFVFLGLMGLFGGYMATMPKRSDYCTRGSLCWLQSDDMFEYAALALYALWFTLFLSLYMLMRIYFTVTDFSDKYIVLRKGISDK